MKYYGDWTDRSGLVGDFGTEDVPDEILFACYTYENYSGSAFVLFEKDGKLYEVNGGHCSCYGLEDQWTPEETTWEALAMRKWLSVEDAAGAEYLTRLIKQRTGQA